MIKRFTVFTDQQYVDIDVPEISEKKGERWEEVMLNQQTIKLADNFFIKIPEGTRLKYCTKLQNGKECQMLETMHNENRDIEVEAHGNKFIAKNKKLQFFRQKNREGLGTLRPTSNTVSVGFYNYKVKEGATCTIFPDGKIKTIDKLCKQALQDDLTNILDNSCIEFRNDGSYKYITDVDIGSLQDRIETKNIDSTKAAGLFFSLNSKEKKGALIYSDADGQEQQVDIEMSKLSLNKLSHYFNEFEREKFNFKPAEDQSEKMQNVAKNYQHISHVPALANTILGYAIGPIPEALKLIEERKYYPKTGKDLQKKQRKTLTEYKNEYIKAVRCFPICHKELEKQSELEKAGYIGKKRKKSPEDKKNNGFKENNNKQSKLDSSSGMSGASLRK